jgi:hypothetical protein
LYSHVHRGVTHNAAERWEQPYVHRWVDKQNVLLHMMEYHSALKTEGIPAYAAEHVMLSETSQARKDKCCLVPLLGGPPRSRITETDSRWWRQGLGRGMRSWISVWEDEQVLERVALIVAQQ